MPDISNYMGRDGFIWFMSGQMAPPTVIAPTAAVLTYKKSLLVPLSSLNSDINKTPAVLCLLSNMTQRHHIK